MMAAASQFFGTIEYFGKVAVVELTDASGAWSGAHRVEAPRVRGAALRSALYEEGYRVASGTAVSKGGHLERFVVVPRPPTVEPCRFGVQGLVLLRRRANALNVEIATPAPRCMLRLPDHWTGAGASAVRWLGSGGSPLVFGECTPKSCPTGADVRTPHPMREQA